MFPKLIFSHVYRFCEEIRFFVVYIYRPWENVLFLNLFFTDSNIFFDIKKSDENFIESDIYIQ